MFKKRTSEMKSQGREKMEKCIFGMHLAKSQNKWVGENNGSNVQFAEFLCVSPRTKNRAIAGEATVSSMSDYAERLGCDLNTMKEVNLRSIIELVAFRFTEREHRCSMILFSAVLLFSIIAIFTKNIGPTLLMIICSNYFLHNGKNLWNIRIDVTKNPDGSQSKLMRAWDVMANISGLILIILICKL